MKLSIDRKELIALHNPVLTEMNEDSPLTVGNGELAFTADVTGLQTLYEEYKTVPLCTMSQWGWHTQPVSGRRYAYTLQDLAMTEYELNGRTVVYPKKKMPGNEAVYDWLRENPHRLNLARIALICQGRAITSSMIGDIRQELHLYEGILESHFTVLGERCAVRTACDNDGHDTLAFQVSGEAVESGRLEVKIDFPYGSGKISGSDWEHGERHRTELMEKSERILLKRTLDQDTYYVSIQTNGTADEQLNRHRIVIHPEGGLLELTVSMGSEIPNGFITAGDVMEGSRRGFKSFWEEGGMIRLNRSRDRRAVELERRIILSQYLMAVNSSGSTPPQETGLTCNSWYGKMHLEMYLWHCAWLPLWNQTGLLERSLGWFTEHLEEARENARRNGYRGARWPKMIAAEGIDCPSPVAPLLVWQQPHIIYMLEMAYRQRKDPQFLETYWMLVEETAEFMIDYVVWNPETGCYDISAPVIPVQECHKETETFNPAFEIEYWRFTLRIALKWAERLKMQDGRETGAGHGSDVSDGSSYQKWADVAEHMACLTERDGVYLAHGKCPDTFTEFNRDHPSMLGAYGLMGSTRIDRETMRRTLHRVVECWDYKTLWGWDFAMMAMTAVRLDEPELAIDIILKDTMKNCYLPNGNNMQVTRKDLPLYLPGNGSLLLAAAIMTAGYEGSWRETPGFPENGEWVVEYEGISPFL